MLTSTLEEERNWFRTSETNLVPNIKLKYKFSGVCVCIVNNVFL